MRKSAILLFGAIAAINLVLLCVLLARLDKREAEARAQAKAACNAWWRAEIARSDAAALKKQAEMAQKALAAEQTAAEQKDALEAALSELEKENETLQNNGCGIDADHVRLLNAASRRAGG